MAPTGKAVRRFEGQEQFDSLPPLHNWREVAPSRWPNRTKKEASYAQEAADRCDTSERQVGNGPRIIKRQRTEESEPSGVRDLQTQLARQKLASREMTERIKTLSAAAEANDQICAELQDELNVAREEILLQQNDKYSLQASLDEQISENVQLAQRLAESEAAASKLSSRFEQAKTALSAMLVARNNLVAELDATHRTRESEANTLKIAKDERNKLVAALDRLQQKYEAENNKLRMLEGERRELSATVEKVQRKYQAETDNLKVIKQERNKLVLALREANKKRQKDVGELTSHLHDATTRAQVAEDLLGKLRHILLEKFKLLQASAGNKDCEIHELEQSRMKLVDGTKLLLKIFEIRDQALVHAEERIRFLSDRINELEAQSYQSNGRQKLAAIDDLTWGQPPAQGLTAGEADHAPENGIAGKLNSGIEFTECDLPRSTRLCLTETMLTATITF
jgi:chromosome segregation ATPase